MPLYDVTLTRSYIVEVNAEDAETAKHVAEFYLGDPSDLSLEHSLSNDSRFFQIGEIEMVVNDAIGVEEIGTLIK